MNVLHASNYYYHAIGGTERYLRLLCDELERNGHKAIFAYAYESPGTSASRPEYLIPFYSDFPPRENSTWVNAFSEILTRESVELVHLHGVWNPQVIRWLSERVPVVRSDHEHSLHCPAGSKYFLATRAICTHPYGPRCLWDALWKGCNSRRPQHLWNTYVRVAAMRSVASCISHFLVASVFVRDWFVRNGYPTEKITVLPYFTELAIWADRPFHYDPAVGREATILFVGRVVQHKGWREFLMALHEIKGRFRAVVDGDGPDLTAMRALSVRLGLAERVHFAGWLAPDEHLECYRRADFVVVPSVWPEPFGMVGIEAMCFGKPVVASRVGGIPEWCEDGVTGLLAEPGNTRDLATKIQLLLDDPPRVRRLGMNARQLVRQRYTAKIHLERLLPIYEQARASYVPRCVALT